MADSGEPIDWSLTTWEGSRREQLRRWAALPLDRVIAALEEMAQLAEQLGAGPQPLGGAPSVVRDPGAGPTE
jgi:hypothetical protein